MSKTAGLKVVGYARCSTSEQSVEGVTLDAQADKIRGYARLHDLELIGIETDAGISAKSLDRPALARVLAMLDRSEISGVIVGKLDRLSRSVSDWNRLIESYFGPAGGKQLFSVADSIDTRSPGGRLVLNVLMSVAQWEREAIADRTRDSLAWKRQNGDTAGTRRFGYRLVDDGRRSKSGQPVKLVEHAGEQAVLAEMRAWRLAGWSDRGIARELDNQGVTPRQAKHWTATAVGRLLRDVPRPQTQPQTTEVSPP